MSALGLDRPPGYRRSSDARYDKRNVVLRREDAPGASLTCRRRTLPEAAQAPNGRSLGMFWPQRRWGNDFRSAGNCRLPAFRTPPYSLRRFATGLRHRRDLRDRDDAPALGGRLLPRLPAAPR